MCSDSSNIRFDILKVLFVILFIIIFAFFLKLVVDRRKFPFNKQKCYVDPRKMKRKKIIKTRKVKNIRFQSQGHEKTEMNQCLDKG